MSVQDDPAAVERCPEDPVSTPDAPYDRGLRTDTDDGGPEARDRHAP
ncbi:hypothetical protein ACFVVP_01995 [Streptomyces sp. NPDC058128]